MGADYFLLCVDCIMLFTSIKSGHGISYQEETMKEKAVYMMAFAPHPLDTEMGIGGTATCWTREGNDIVYVVCTNGDKGSSDPKMKPEERDNTIDTKVSSGDSGYLRPLPTLPFEP